MTAFDDNPNLNDATSRRLRRLSTMPVDLTSLEARLEKAIPRPGKARSAPWKISFRPMHAVAASLLVGAISLTLVLTLAAQPVVASPQVLENLYHNSALAEGHSMHSGGDSPVMACCVQHVKGKQVTCLALDSKGTRVSMVVADAKNIQVPAEALRKELNGLVYYVQSSPRINMVMTVRGTTWVCLMGPVPEADLVKLISSTPVTNPPVTRP